MNPKLTLVGAGPGDGELITLKGVKALRVADVVLYDALANESLLDFAPKNIPLIFVGKRKGQHSLRQQEINELIVQSAFQYGHVVRLKGGDPFVFGRGYEEIQYAQSFGIQTAVVPGVSSCTAVPAMQQIPVTSRGYAQSFWVMTGTTQTGELADDIHLAVQSSATLVILMGMSKLTEILDLFRKVGKSEIPIAIIQNGTLPNERWAVGQVNDILSKADKLVLNSPAIIIIGEVVKLHIDYVKEYVEMLSV